MIAVTLGPLALPVAPLLLLAATWGAAALADRLRPGVAAGGPVLHAVAVGLVAARLVHLALHADAYATEPMSALDLRDGGWHLPSGLAAGVAWVAWRAWRRPDWRRPLAIASVAGLAAWGAGTAVLAPGPRDALPDVPLTDLATGEPVRLAALADGRPVVLNLWASWCAPCRREMPAFAEVAARHPDVLFVFANQGEDAGTVRRYLAQEHLTLPAVVLDRPSALGTAVGSTGLPTTVFHDARGRRVDAHMGPLNAAALTARVRALAD